MVDFVAFQDISLKRLQRLQQALADPGTQRPPPPLREGRAALQRRLWQQLMELREAQPGALGVRLLRALRAARLPGLERSIREHFLRAR